MERRQQQQQQQQQQQWQARSLDDESETSSFATSLSNVVVNEALLIAVLSLTTYAVLTVDSDAWRGWYPYEILFRVPLDNWNAYETAVAVDPVPIKAAITGVTYLLGDFLAQGQELKNSGREWLDFDRARLFRSTMVGLLFLGPLAHFYYEFVADGLDDWSIPSKIFIDQTAYLAFYNTVYYVGLSVFAGKGLGRSIDEYRQKFFPAADERVEALAARRHRDVHADPAAEPRVVDRHDRDHLLRHPLVHR